MDLLSVFCGILFLGFLWLFFEKACDIAKHPFFMEKTWFIILSCGIACLFIKIVIPFCVIFLGGLFSIEPEIATIIGWFAGGLAVLIGFLLGLGNQIDDIMQEDMKRE